MKARVLNLAELVRYYDAYNRSENKSPSTLRWYNQVLRLFLEWLTDTGRSTNLCDIDEMCVREFILEVQSHITNGHPVSIQTIHNRVRALRAFFNWLYQHNYTETHVLQNLHPPRLPQVMIKTLTDEEITRIFASQEQSTMNGSRNTAIMALFVDTGLRLSELAGVKLTNVNLEDQYVKVMGKGSKERMIAFGAATRRTLLQYATQYRGEPAHPGIDQFFLTVDGYGMTPEGVKSQVRRIAKASGVTRLYPHLCRHTYATNFLINGGDVLLLKQNLGHTTLAMVDHYVHLATSRVAILSKSFSPLDKMNLHCLRRGGFRARHFDSKKERIYAQQFMNKGT